MLFLTLQRVSTRIQTQTLPHEVFLNATSISPLDYPKCTDQNVEIVYTAPNVLQIRFMHKLWQVTDPLDKYMDLSLVNSHEKDISWVKFPKLLTHYIP